MAGPEEYVLPVVEAFSDGSYLSEISASGDQSPHDAVTVHVVKCFLDRLGDDTVYRLITTICDPVQAPATELVDLYHQWWEIEPTLDETKTHQGGPRLVLRFQHPDGTEQEIYGFLLVHHALPEVMHRTAHRTGTDPDRPSFTRPLHIARRHVTAQAALPLTAESGTRRHRPTTRTSPATPPTTPQPPCHQTQDDQLRYWLWTSSEMIS
ncbi:hypothetical protein [Streptomyces sp. NPDC001719]